MSKPYFEVGEEVIVCSRDLPELNGPAVIIGVGKTPQERCQLLEESNPGFAFDVLNDVGIAYLTDPPSKGHTFPVGLWNQSALRKKHDPGKSFDKLMSDLKQPLTT